MKMKTLVFGLLALAMGTSYAVAANEIAGIDGNVSYAEVGTVHISSGPNRSGETRRLATNQLGYSKTVKAENEVVFSTGIGGAGGLFTSGNSSNTFTVTSSSWIGAVGCRNIGDNCNVVRLASQEFPVFVDKVIVGDVLGGQSQISPLSQRVTVRLFDSQGSTSTAFLRFKGSFSTGTWSPVDVEFSSGVTIMKDITADVAVYLGRQTR